MKLSICRIRYALHKKRSWKSEAWIIMLSKINWKKLGGLFQFKRSEEVDKFNDLSTKDELYVVSFSGVM